MQCFHRKWCKNQHKAATTYRQSTSDIWTLLANNSKTNKKDLFQHFRAAGRDGAFLACLFLAAEAQRGGCCRAAVICFLQGQSQLICPGCLLDILVTDTAEEESLFGACDYKCQLLALGYTQTLLQLQSKAARRSQPPPGLRSFIIDFFSLHLHDRCARTPRPWPLDSFISKTSQCAPCNCTRVAAVMNAHTHTHFCPKQKPDWVINSCLLNDDEG